MLSYPSHFPDMAAQAWSEGPAAPRLFDTAWWQCGEVVVHFHGARESTSYVCPTLAGGERVLRRLLAGTAPSEYVLLFSDPPDESVRVFHRDAVLAVGLGDQAVMVATLRDVAEHRTDNKSALLAELGGALDRDARYWHDAPCSIAADMMAILVQAVHRRGLWQDAAGVLRMARLMDLWRFAYAGGVPPAPAPSVWRVMEDELRIPRDTLAQQYSMLCTQ